MAALEEDADDAEDIFDPGLFLNEDYAEHSYELGEGAQQTCLCLEGASTDHDLTGQVVWPVSVALARFVAARLDSLKGRRVVEVGAGKGYWCALLQARGVDAVAFDAKPPPETFAAVREGGPEALLGDAHRDRSLLLCYPDDECQADLDDGEDLSSALQLTDQYVYDNNFIYFQPGNGKLKYKEPKDQVKVAQSKLKQIIAAL